MSLSHKELRKEKKAAAEPGKVVQLDEHSKTIIEVRKLLFKREEARLDMNFTLADSIRDKLNELGVEIQDQKNGSGPPGWKFRDGSTRKLPAGINIGNIEGAVKKRKRDDVRDEKQETAAGKDGSTKPTKVSKISKTALTEEQRNKATLAAVVGEKKSNATTIDGVLIEEVKLGAGEAAQNGNRLKMMYVGRLKANNRIFDSSKKPFSFRLGRGEVIRGWDIGCLGMRVGGKRTLTIPPQKGYGKTGAPPTIPGNATLVFDISLVEIQ